MNDLVVADKGAAVKQFCAFPTRPAASRRRPGGNLGVMEPDGNQAKNWRSSSLLACCYQEAGGPKHPRYQSQPPRQRPRQHYVRPF
jgi:hypothetical protein